MAQTRARSLCTAATSGVLAVVGVVVLSAGPAFAADHTVQPGENLVGIARQHGVTVADLVRINGLSDPNHVVAGTTLHLPSRTTKPAAKTAAKPAAPTRGSAATKAATALAGKGPAYTLGDDQRRQVNQLLDRAAREFGVKPSLLKALTYTESRWHQDAVSSVGAIGVGQLLPATATWLAGLMGEPGLDVRSTQDNVRLSARLLRLLLRPDRQHQAGAGRVLPGHRRGAAARGLDRRRPLRRDHHRSPGLVLLAAALRVTAVTRPSGGAPPALAYTPGPRRRPPATRGRPWQTTNRLQKQQDDFTDDVEEEPEDLAEEPLEDELDEEGEFDPDLDEDAALETDDVVEDEEEEEEEAPRRPVTAEDEEDDEDLVDPDDVEADLDTILKDRLVAAEDTPDEDEEEAEPEERGEAGDRLQPKRADEQLCPSCFLLVRRTAPSCLIGDEDCPLFS